MKKSTRVIIFSYVVIGLSFLSFILLPSLAKGLSIDNIKPLNIWIGLFFAFFLSHPYIRTIQLILNPSMAGDAPTFSDYRQKGMALEYWISRAMKLIIFTVVISMGLTNLFMVLSIPHYLIIPLAT